MFALHFETSCDYIDSIEVKRSCVNLNESYNSGQNI